MTSTPPQSECVLTPPPWSNSVYIVYTKHNVYVSNTTFLCNLFIPGITYTFLLGTLIAAMTLPFTQSAHTVTDEQIAVHPDLAKCNAEFEQICPLLCPDKTKFCFSQADRVCQCIIRCNLTDCQDHLSCLDFLPCHQWEKR